MFILSLDPGLTVGWASFRKPNSRDGYASGQWTYDAVGFVHQLDLIHAMNPLDLVVYERFDYRSGLAKANLTPVENIGVLKYWLDLNQVQSEEQWPHMAVGPKAFYNDDRLKLLGVYNVGHKHANDAMRHLLYYLSFGSGTRLGESRIHELKKGGE